MSAVTEHLAAAKAFALGTQFILNSGFPITSLWNWSAGTDPMRQSTASMELTIGFILWLKIRRIFQKTLQPGHWVLVRKLKTGSCRQRFFKFAQGTFVDSSANWPAHCFGNRKGKPMSDISSCIFILAKELVWKRYGICPWLLVERNQIGALAQQFFYNIEHGFWCH